MKKHTCCKCSEIGVWYYVPWDSEKVERLSYYCEDHIRRGCSCNTIKLNPDPDKPEDFEQHKDEQGRLLPCCEYDYSETGFDKAEDFAEKYDAITAEYDKD